jgi:hypothetical protein
VVLLSGGTVCALWLFSGDEGALVRETWRWDWLYFGLVIEFFRLSFVFKFYHYRDQLLARTLLGIAALLKFQRVFFERLFDWLGVHDAKLDQTKASQVNRD